MLAGVVVNNPFAVLVKLGQDYLPTRTGTASGVTLGLANSVGGLAAPVLGAVAQAYGTGTTMAVLCAVPLPTLALAMLLPRPSR